MSAAFGCSNGAERSQDQVLELYSWWTNPGETDALTALLAAYEADHPRTHVINAAVTGNVNAREQLHSRMVSGMPPDTFQALGGWDLLQWVLFNGVDDSESKMEPLDFLVEQKKWSSLILQPIRNAVSHDGKTYGIPIGIHRYNVLYYNKKVFDQNGLQPPSSWEQFYQVAESLQARGVVPLALGNKLGWPAALLAWDGILIAQSGADFHDSYLTGKESANDPRIVAMLDETVKVLAHTNGNRDLLTWDEAAQMVVDGTASMTIMGDWAKGFFLSKGMKPGVDFGQLPTPGTRGVFVYLVDSFGLPRGVQNRQATLDFLGLIGSEEAQDLFNPIKGSTPPRIDADKSRYDVMAQDTIVDFQSGRLSLGREVIVASPEFNNEFVTTMRQFVSDKNVDTVVNMLKNRYDLLQASD